MTANMLRHWIKKLGEKLLSGDSRRSRRPRFGAAHRRATMKPTVETLESRLTPSVKPVIPVDGPSRTIGSEAAVAPVIAPAIAPLVNSSSANLLNNATSMTINGTGFDATTANDSVTFDDGVTGTVAAATGTSLTVSLTGLTSVTAGAALDAVVTVDGASSGSAVQVATVQSPTTTSLTDNGPNSSIVGNAVSYTVNTTGVPDSSTVYLEDASNSNAIVGSVVVTGDTGGTTVSSLSIGTHEIFAVYTGAAGYVSSQSSPALLQTVDPISVSTPVINGDFAPIVDLSEASNTATITTDGNNGFSAGNQVVIAGETGTAIGYNGTWSITAASGDTFTYTNTTASLPSLNFNSNGYAISANTSSTLIGSQRSMVDSVAYTFNTPVSLTTGAVTLGLQGGVTASGWIRSTAAAGVNWTSLSGGTTWVMTFSSAAGNTVTGHSIADNVYTLTLNSADVTAVADSSTMTTTRAADTFFRLYGDVVSTGGSSTETVDSDDVTPFNNTYLMPTGQAGYLGSLDYLGNGRVNANEVTQFNDRYTSSWSGFTATI